MEEREAVVSRIREFNRFYTVLLGLLNRDYLHSGYSVTETRILFELGQREGSGANQLIETLRLDKSYISRLIRGFEQKGILTREVSPEDGRAFVIRLTPRGQEEVNRLIDVTNHQISGLIQALDSETCENLCAAMDVITESFSAGNRKENTE